MDDDQQFCLRWNNHQSTLVAVFDTLLENGTLVDCTLAAEGKYLNAHKVVLSACSPYFEALLAQNYDKHPIFILKDVKFQELKAMMDYMYRGEVNISQDQLGALLKAAESLQIKGLSDNRKGETETRKSAPPPPPPAKSPTPAPSLPRVQGLTIEQRRTKDDDSAREGSQSPGPRKRKRVRRRSTDDLDNHHDASNSSESHHSNQTPAQNIPATLPAVSKIAADVPEPLETKSEILTRHKTSESEIPQVPIKEKLEATHTELMLEPKAEYVDEMNEDSIEDLTLDDDDISNMDQMDDGAGPSHGNAGEGSSQGFGGWHMGNQGQDEVFLAAQEAVGAHRDSQDSAAMEKLEVKGEKTKDQLVEVKDELGSHVSFYKKRIVKVVRGEGKIIKKVLMTPKQKMDAQKTVEQRLIDEIFTDEQHSGDETATQSTTSPTNTAEATSDADAETEKASASKVRKAPMPKRTKAIAAERMKRFLAMAPEDLPKPTKKQYACERDIKEIKFPKDTLRCLLCGVLYERENHAQHQKECTRSLQAKPKYGCALCNFKHTDKQEIQKHISAVHRKSASK